MKFNILIIFGDKWPYIACLIKVTLSKDLYSFGLELSSILPIAIQLILFGLKFSEIEY